MHPNYYAIMLQDIDPEELLRDSSKQYIVGGLSTPSADGFVCIQLHTSQFPHVCD